MSSMTRKIAEAVDQHGSIEAYLAWLDQTQGSLIPLTGETLSPPTEIYFEPSTKIHMSRRTPPPPPQGRLIREGGPPMQADLNLLPQKDMATFHPSKIMNFKVIEVVELQTDLLIRRDFTDNGDPCVILTFYATDSDLSEYQHEELIEFESSQSAKLYVRDFSPASAVDFIQENLRRPSLD